MSRPRPGIFSLSVLVFPKGGDCINARQRKKAKASRLEASRSRSLVSSRLTFAAKAGPFVPVAAEGTSETDWLPEQERFELSVPPQGIQIEPLFKSNNDAGTGRWYSPAGCGPPSSV